MLSVRVEQAHQQTSPIYINILTALQPITVDLGGVSPRYVFMPGRPDRVSLVELTPRRVECERQRRGEQAGVMEHGQRGRPSWRCRRIRIHGHRERPRQRVHLRADGQHLLIAFKGTGGSTHFRLENASISMYAPRSKCAESCERHANAVVCYRRSMSCCGFCILIAVTMVTAWAMAQSQSCRPSIAGLPVEGERVLRRQQQRAAAR